MTQYFIITYSNTLFIIFTKQTNNSLQRALGLHEKVVEGIESQGLKAAVFDKVLILVMMKMVLQSLMRFLINQGDGDHMFFFYFLLLVLHCAHV